MLIKILSYAKTTHFISSGIIVFITIILLIHSSIVRSSDCSGYFNECYQKSLHARADELSIVRWSIDWIGVNQVNSLVILDISTIFSAYSAWLANRRYILIGSTLELFSTIQIVYLYFGDDRGKRASFQSVN